jgi:peptide/nickel transport system substrate-binding protein
MDKSFSIAAILSILLLGSMLLNPALAAGNPPISPLIKRPMSLDEATIEDGSPETVDPSWAYDTASAEIIFNVYDTLITFDAEHMERYLPSIATDALLQELPPGTLSPEGIPWYYKYTFEIRGQPGIHSLQSMPGNYSGVGSPMNRYFTEVTGDPRWLGTFWKLTSWTDTDLSGDLTVSDDIDLTRACRNGVVYWNTTQYFHVDAVPLDGTVPYTITLTEKKVQFQAPWFYELTTTDVMYSFERTMVQDRSAGPAWMLYEPLFNSWGAAGLGNGDLGDPANVALVGAMLDHAVESNATHVWFNIGFPGSYAPFWQILSQTWASIMSKQWIVNYVIGDLGRPDWNGEWGDYSGWVTYHDPAISPLDEPSPIAYGSGPFCLSVLDYTAMTWILNRFHEYWRGWPATFPSYGGASPAGYVESMSSTWAYAWNARSTMFLAGDVDLCAVPRSLINTMYKSASPPFAPPNYPLDGLRCVMPLPSLSCDALFFTFDINPATVYGKINDYGVYSSDGIPRDFFGSAADGKHVRSAFASAFDYDTFLAQAYLGEAMHPATAIIPGLLYYTPVDGWTYDLTRATLEFQACPTLWNTGFTIQILYNTGNEPRKIAAQLLETAIEGISPVPGRFNVDVVSVDWRTYLGAAGRHQLGLFIIGWLADYPDPHNFAFSFYHTYGSFPLWQLYSNPTMDQMIEEGIQLPNGPLRQAKYTEIQLYAVEDVPSTTILQPIGRHFERDWLVGWYYNPIYPGLYGYNLWKWYYVPHVLMDPVVQPTSFYQPADINYDGKCDMKDIGTTAKSFGATAGPPIQSRWVFRADFNGDRKIDMKDIGFVAKNFGKQGPKWVPTP